MKIIRTLALGAFLAIGAAACDGNYYATAQLDEPVYERPVAPSAEYVWIGGDWVWSGGRYTYRNGYWSRPRTGRVWVNGNWSHTNRGYYWNRGHWR